MTYIAPRYVSPPIPDRMRDHPIVVIGAGMVGLTVALDLARRGQPVVVLDDEDTVSIGSRAICHAKRSLEIFARLGLGAAVLAKGVTWNRGRVFFGARQVYDFDLQVEAGHQFPAFVNLQQYHLEEMLVDACVATGLVDLRWKHAVCAIDDGRIGIETPDGAYDLRAAWVLAADGARSFVRRALALPFTGTHFPDRFLIADVRMDADFPPERWFWFEPAFHPGGSVLLHRQADKVWRIDFQLGPDADAELERDPDRVRARVAAMLGPDAVFTLEWVSIYSFRCRRLDQFRHGRVIFLGDAAHQVSPFGARGGNSGVQDADNLAWKLDAVLRGLAPETLLDSYEAERIPASDENIGHSIRSTEFIAPKSAAARAYRDAVLELSAHFPFARALVNSGRLSRPAVLVGSALNTPDSDAWAGGVRPGAVAEDAPIGDGWLLHQLGPGFTVLRFDTPDGAAHRFVDPTGIAAARYDATPGTTILLRPDGHVAARWRHYDPALVAAACRRALGG